MSEEFELKFKATLDGEEIASAFDEAGRNADRFGSRLQSVLKGAGGAISAFAGKAQSELQAFAGKELGGSLGSQARGVLQLRDSITALIIAADKSTDIFGGLKDQIQATSKASNQLQGDVTDALRAFVDQTGDIDTARKNIELYGKAATATGAAIKDVALVGVELADKLNIKDQAKAFDILAMQSKGGAIHLRDLAKQGPRLFNVAASAGVSGEEGLREIGALAEVYAKYVGGADASKAARVSTAVENTFASIAKKASRLEAAGIHVEGRDRFEVLFDIIRKTGGNETKLREVFSQQAMRAILGVANEYKSTGKFGDFEKLRDVKVDRAVLNEDFADRMKTGESKIKQQQIARQTFYDKYLGGIAEFGAAHAGELQIGSIALGYAGKGLGLLGGSLGGRVGGAIAGATASRVFVVNWPGALGGAPGGGPAGALGNVTQFLGAAGTGLALGAFVGNYLDKHSSTARGFYNAEANLIDRVSGSKGKRQALEDSGVDLNRLRIQRLKGEREDLIRDFEGKGYSHGKAVYSADQQIQAEVKNLTVVINGDQAHVETDSGTRAPEVLVKRNAGGG